MANSFIYKDQTFHTGDTVKLHLSVTEGDKTRNQIFEGIIIGIRGEGSGRSITVRKIASGELGVERIVPVNSPTLTKIDLKTLGQVRRAKLGYLRSRVGRRATKVKTKSDSSKPVKKSTSASKPKPSPANAVKKTKRPARRASSPKTSSK